jgi:SPP1 gp7 family putative phage head morphogenesis protein
VAITEQTLHEVTTLRLTIDRHVNEATARQVTAWTAAWAELQATWQDTVDELAAAAKDGRWPARRTVLTSERVRQALADTRAALERLISESGATITGELPTMVRATITGTRRVIETQLPPAHGLALADPDTAALDAIVKRTAGNITALHRPLPAMVERSLRAVLVRGVAVGENPRAAAAEMLRRARGEFDGGLTRALVIARTEMLDAHRAAGQASDHANNTVVAEWEWLSALDRRTCPSCWAMHGTRHPISEAGPEDHQQGRCARVPVTRSWRDLGFDLDEPPSLGRDAEATFRALPRTEQVAVMGAARLAKLDAGTPWSALAVKRSTVGWRDSWAPTPVKDL